MRRRDLRGWWLASLLAMGACGSGAKQQRGDDDLDDFACSDRRADYILAGGFGAAESGVQLDCADGPRLVRWTLDDGDGQRHERSMQLSGGEFDDLWRQVDDTGWRNLEDCDNPRARDDDQVYTFEITDGDTRKKFTCPGKELPFPYDRLVTAFDLAAGRISE
jgi:hypothetical protein